MWIPDLLVVALIACVIGVTVLARRRAERAEREGLKWRPTVARGEGGGFDE